MRISKKILCVIFAVIFVCGSGFAFISSAAKSSPLSVEIKTNRDKASTIGEIYVTVTVKNNSNEGVSNVVVTSDHSEKLCYYKPVSGNVVISYTKNGLPCTMIKKSSMTTFLPAGGTIKYTYRVLLGYSAAKEHVSELTLKKMYRQHLLLNTKAFVGVDVSSGSKVAASKVLTFGDIDTKLAVTAYYGLKTSDYKAITE